jgi:hypothetical protein
MLGGARPAPAPKPAAVKDPFNPATMPPHIFEGLTGKGWIPPDDTDGLDRILMKRGFLRPERRRALEAKVDKAEKRAARFLEKAEGAAERAREAETLAAQMKNDAECSEARAEAAETAAGEAKETAAECVKAAEARWAPKVAEMNVEKAELRETIAANVLQIETLRKQLAAAEARAVNEGQAEPAPADGDEAKPEPEGEANAG